MRPGFICFRKIFLRVGTVAQVVECSPIKLEALRGLSSSPSTRKKKKRKKERKKIFFGSTGV
jgi:hypothetical protein